MASNYRKCHFERFGVLGTADPRRAKSCIVSLQESHKAQGSSVKLYQQLGGKEGGLIGQCTLSELLASSKNRSFSNI